MASVFLHMRVKDYPVWKNVFDTNAGFRTSNGALTDQVFTDAEDPNTVFVLFKWNSLANASKFLQSPELKAAMEKAGVEGAPHYHLMNEK